ncbi:MAG: acetate/propionate family kinase, partial [Candidatus Omnitrophica bacterium]|nr:acetate/propionate family kinase [Candidatus Omnitrophota bacterium]
QSIQCASFDTAFHTTLPKVSYLYAIPYSFYEKHKIRKYGFHGTSHRYVARRTAEIMGKGKYDINAITCHLGNGCSITAVKNGKSFDTSMGLTPLEGLIMGTRPGDIDPGVILYFMEGLNLKPSEINEILNKRSGLLGISEKSNDFRNLLPIYGKDEKVTLAIDMFCYRLKKYIGSYMAVLGKVDAIVFTGGIGENVPIVRENSLNNMENFGVVLDEKKNKETIGKEGEISKEESRVKIFVIPTNEELRIAFDTYQIIKKSFSE